MELKTVILALGPEWRAGEAELKRRLGLAGVAWTAPGQPGGVPGGKKGAQAGAEAGRFGEEKARLGEKKERFGREKLQPGEGEARIPSWGERINVRDTVAVTDDRVLARDLAAFGTVCVGVSPADAPYFEGAELVTDEPGELDVQMLEKCLLHAQGKPVTIAKTDRLVLREISEQDFDGLYRISRQDGMAYAQGEPEENCFEAERLAAYIGCAYRLQEFGLWSVFLKDGTLIGCCGLYRSDEPGSGAEAAPEGEDEPGSGTKAVPEEEDKPGNGAEAAPKGEDESGSRTKAAPEEDHLRLELQYMVAQEFRGRGYGAEMCRAALRFAAEETSWDEIWVQIRPDNAASLHLAKKLGFVFRRRDGRGILQLSRRLS